MRERCEDLGKLSILIDQLLDHELFSECKMRPKDYPDWFYSQLPEKQADVLRGFSYGMQAIEDLILTMREISRGEDELNQSADA